MIKEYDLDIYPCKLWVSIKSSPNELLDNFEICSVKDFYETIEISTESLAKQLSNKYAVTIPVKSKLSDEIGVLIHLPELDLDNKIIVHESVHAADYVFDLTDSYSQSFADGNEPYAYLVEWIAGKTFLTVKEAIDENRRYKIRRK